jgi:hypothetical protein
MRFAPATSSSSSGWAQWESITQRAHLCTRDHVSRHAYLAPHGCEYAEEADMSLRRHYRYVGGIGSVVTACALVLSGCGGTGGDDGPNTNTNGTETNTTDDTTTLTRPPTTATTIENSA